MNEEELKKKLEESIDFELADKTYNLCDEFFTATKDRVNFSKMLKSIIYGLSGFIKSVVCASEGQQDLEGTVRKSMSFNAGMAGCSLFFLAKDIDVSGFEKAKEKIKPHFEF